MEYEGTYYAAVGDFLRQNYLELEFTQGTAQEVGFLLELMKLPAGSRILDVGCGPGRHSLELARRGHRVVGVDISRGFIEVARAGAREEKLPAEFQVADARALQFEEEFDAAICLCEGAFGLAGDEEGQRQVIAGIARALRRDGPLVLTAINALGAAVRHPEGPALDPYTCTLHERAELKSPAGEMRTVDLYTTCFTARELRWLLQDAGFGVDGAYGCTPGAFGRRPLTVQDMEVMIVARKR